VAKVKVVKTNLDGNLHGNYFLDMPSNTIFSFGKFFVTSNFDNKTTIDYTNSLSSFVNPITLDTIGVNDTQSEIIQTYTTNAVLNLDKSDLNTFVRYGSAYEFLRTSIQNIILAYPGSLFANSQKNVGGNQTYTSYEYDPISDITTFYMPTACTVNTFGLVYNDGNDNVPDDNELKNLNLSYENYVIWSNLEPDTLFKVIGYTGNTINSSSVYNGTSLPVRDYLRLQVEGNPFGLTGSSVGGTLDYHLRPNNVAFEEFRALLNGYEQNIVSFRDGTDGFSFILKDPTILEDGNIIYSDTKIIWSTGDMYNVDVNTPKYQTFLEIVLSIGAKYDTIKTDLIARFLTPASLKTYDFTDEGKVTKLLRLYGREFDQIRQFIDSLVNINKVTYDKLNNVPDQIIKNMANTFGWDYFSLVNEEKLVEGFLTVDDIERDLNEDILPAEIDVELWRRILNNTSYFWKSKGTREAIKSMFLLIGIPEPFINITEYVYTVDGKIDPNTVTLAQGDFPSNSLPYDTEGYPVAPLETPDFYFQLSGNTDSGQAYLDVFRSAGFNLQQTPDNKKSWVEASATTRVHYSTPQYYQEDSRLVINTKEVDVALDTARGIEYDVYSYIQKDFTANSSGYTLPYSFVNISLGLTGDTQTTFKLPDSYTSNGEVRGDLEVRYNGILLNAPKIFLSGATGTTDTDYEADYVVDPLNNTFTLSGSAYNNASRRDVIEASFIYSGATSLTGMSINVKYIVTRIDPNLVGTTIPLPSYPRGDLQLTINGIALTKGTPQFVADYILDPANSSGGSNNIIIQNPEIISYLAVSPYVQIAYVEVTGSNDINMRSEVVRIDSFNSSKIYFNNGANKYVYKLNYRVNNASEVKFLVDGIALEPYTDYSINVQNPYEIFLPRGLRYGTVLSAYYLVADSGAFQPVINDVFGLGDISELSFLEFLELMQRKMINARNRKVVTDFKGGWYPTLLRIYETYLKREQVPIGPDPLHPNPLHSNGYTFENLYPFLSKYNAFFQRFVDQLLSATIIIKRGGLLIRNSVFTKQKHWYKRGVNVSDGTTTDLRGNPLLQYLGTDGATFSIVQEILAPPPPPTQLYIETTPAIEGSVITGGRNIIGFNELTEYGIDFRLYNPYPSYPYGGSIPIGLDNLLEGINYDIELLADNWTRISQTGPLAVNNFTMTIDGVEYSTTYQYRAFVESLSTGATGNTLLFTTSAAPPPPYQLSTRIADSVGQNDIYDTGGYQINGFGVIDYYAMQYRVQGTSVWNLEPAPPSLGPLGSNNWYQDIENLVADTTYEYRAYMQIDGLNYYGNTRTITTSPIPLALPFLFNDNVSGITYTTADVTGSIISNGNPDYTVRGIVWGTSPNPTVALPTKTTESPVGSPTGIFTNEIGPLSPNTTYYVRAYATNSQGTAYGAFSSGLPFTTPNNEILVSFTNVQQYGTGGNIINAWVTNFTTYPALESGETFDINYTLRSCSQSSVQLPKVIRARSCVMKLSTIYDTTETNLPQATIGNLNDNISGNVQFTCSNYDCYQFCTTTVSAVANSSASFQNWSSVEVDSISNCVGLSGKVVTFTGPDKIVACTTNASNFNEGGVVYPT